NNVDDDCDGTTDEDAVASCLLPHGSASCVAGACRIMGCEKGYDNCDGKQPNGCEQSLSDSMDCGACGTICDPRAACVDNFIEVVMRMQRATRRGWKLVSRVRLGRNRSAIRLRVAAGRYCRVSRKLSATRRQRRDLQQHLHDARR